jgi:hypothetical protein
MNVAAYGPLNMNMFRFVVALVPLPPYHSTQRRVHFPPSSPRHVE